MDNVIVPDRLDSSLALPRRSSCAPSHMSRASDHSLMTTAPPSTPSAEGLSLQEEASLVKHFFDLDAAALSDVEGDQESDLMNGNGDSTASTSPPVVFPTEIASPSVSARIPCSLHSRETSPLTPLTLSREPSLARSNSERVVLPDVDNEAEQRRLQRSKSILDGSYQ